MIDLSTVKITRGRRATISLTILRDGSISVKAPHLIPKRIIEEFVKSKTHWIEKRQNLVLRNKKGPKKFENGEKFVYFGKEYELQLGPYVHIEIHGDKLLFPLALAKRGQETMEKWYIKQARVEIKKLVDEYAGKMETSYNGISFSDTRSQWGRCTHDNRLQFSWRLVMTPLLVVRYVVIHELAHTTEKNHSSRFWNIVRANNPSYKQQIKWLKENGHGLIA